VPPPKARANWNSTPPTTEILPPSRPCYFPNSASTYKHRNTAALAWESVCGEFTCGNWRFGQGDEGERTDNSSAAAVSLFHVLLLGLPIQAQ
jgi:hypothetical protein